MQAANSGQELGAPAARTSPGRRARGRPHANWRGLPRGSRGRARASAGRSPRSRRRSVESARASGCAAPRRHRPPPESEADGAARRPRADGRFDQDVLPSLAARPGYCLVSGVDGTREADLPRRQEPGLLGFRQRLVPKAPRRAARKAAWPGACGHPRGRAAGAGGRARPRCPRVRLRRSAVVDRTRRARRTGDRRRHLREAAGARAAAARSAGVEIKLVEASAEAVPLPDESFDVVFCDHGAFNFTDPNRSVPEAARLLRPGGLLAFSVHLAPDRPLL